VNTAKKKSIQRVRDLAQRWLLVISAPATISLLAIIITNLAARAPVPLWLVLLTFLFAASTAILYLASYTRALARLMLTISRSMRSKRFRTPHILVLDGTIAGDPKEIPPTPVHSDRTPADWRAALSNMEELNPPDIVVNPFGEVYPETDFNSHAIASMIRKYVWDGGIYVNTAGIPFWYRYDPKDARRETAGRVEGIFDDKPRWTTVFHDTFPNLTPAADPSVVQCAQTEDAIRRFGDFTGAGGADTVTMFRSYPVKPPTLLPMLFDSGFTRCIIGAHQFGDGAYLISAVSIDNGNLAFEKTVAAIHAWISYEQHGRPA